MPVRALTLAPFVLLLACGPTHADPADDDSSSTGDPSTTSTTDALASSSTDPDGDTTSVLDTSSTESESSTTGGESSTGEHARPTGGRFALTGDDAVVEPAGCVVGEGPDASAWTIEFELPSDGDAFPMLETFGPYSSSFDCMLAPEGFACTHTNVVDYARFSGTDASVHHESTYDVEWDGEQLLGAYSAEFSCTGSECADVLADWQLVGFPCAIAVSFTGEILER